MALLLVYKSWPCSYYSSGHPGSVHLLNTTVAVCIKVIKKDQMFRVQGAISWPFYKTILYYILMLVKSIMYIQILNKQTKKFLHHVSMGNPLKTKVVDSWWNPPKTILDKTIPKQWLIKHSWRTIAAIILGHFSQIFPCNSPLSNITKTLCFSGSRQLKGGVSYLSSLLHSFIYSFQNIIIMILWIIISVTCSMNPVFIKHHKHINGQWIT